MSNHSKVFVPLETCFYYSPDLSHRGVGIDAGLLAESLIYYDQVVLAIETVEGFAELAQWFHTQGEFDTFLAMIKDKTLTVYEYSFRTSLITIVGDTKSMLVNAQFPGQEKRNSFRSRYLQDEKVKRIVPGRDNRKKFKQLLGTGVIEAKAADFGPPITAARLDFANERRGKLITDAIIGELSPLIGITPPPTIDVKIVPGEGEQFKIHFHSSGPSIDQIGLQLGKQMKFSTATILNSVATANRTIWSAARLNCDMYLGKPLSTIVGDKLYESGKNNARVKSVVESLVSEVEFPNLRELVNTGKITLHDVLHIRKKAKRFREWLQQAGARDQDAIIAYHTEVSKDSGFTSVARKTLSMFGSVAGTVGGTAIGGYIAGPDGALIGAGVGAAVQKGADFITEAIAQSGSGWKPIVFGQWLDKQIKELLKDFD